MPDARNQERNALLKAIGGMVGISAFMFAVISGLSEDADGLIAGVLVSALSAVVLAYAVRFYFSNVKGAFHKLILVAVVIMQITPFLFGGIYGAFGYDGSCIDLATGPLDALYFSYTTFTTVGYGDMAPIGYCRAVSSVQGMVGYLLLGALGAALFAAVDTHPDRS